MVEPSNFKVVIVWLLIGTVIFLGWSWYEREQVASRVITNPGAGGTGGSLQIQRSRNGHYFLMAQVDGKEVPFMLDTGATSTAISARQASRLGLTTNGSVNVNTANGVVTADLARATVELPGLIAIENLRLTILKDMDDTGLLGMDVLGKLKLTQEGLQLTLSHSR